MGEECGVFIQWQNRMRALRGVRAWAALLAAGALAGLSLPPVNGWFLWALAFPVLLIWLEGQAGLRASFRGGWWFGFGYLMVALHWIGFAFLVDAKTYLWMMPFAVAGLAGFLALYWGLGAVAARLLARGGLPLVVALPVSLAVTEWLRGHLLTGFPWAAPGLAANGMAGVVQLAAVMGMTGLTLMVLLWALGPLLVGRGGAARFAGGALLALLLAAEMWGEQRVAAHPTVNRPAVTLRLVQPNVAQDDKWRAENTRVIFDRLKMLSTAPPHGSAVTHIIWPESAVSFFIDESEQAQAELAGVLAGGKWLLAGALRRELRPDGGERVFTSLIVFDDRGHPVSHYDKWRLVPGGEFLPFEAVLRPLGFRRLVTVPESFDAGPGPVSLAIPGAGKAAPFICYEVIFPDRLVDAGDRPQWLVNITNDGWFGRSTGPWQHFAQARLRAVEQGLPLVRAANTGISGVIDPVGRIVVQSALEQQTYLDVALPEALSPTPYARFGDGLLTALVLAVAAAGWFVRKSL